MDKDGFVPGKTGQVHEIGARDYKEFPSADRSYPLNMFTII